MSGADSPPRRTRRTLAIAACLGLALAGAQTWLLTVCAVRGASMEPTLEDGQRVLVWRPGSPRRGDLVVFWSPLAPELLVKRVVAAAGETVGSHEGLLVVDGFPLHEPWVKPGTSLGALAPVVVPAGKVYVLGDNRAESIDSRAFGPIDLHLAQGVVLCKAWPPAGLGR